LEVINNPALDDFLLVKYIVECMKLLFHDMAWSLEWQIWISQFNFNIKVFNPKFIILVILLVFSITSINKEIDFNIIGAKYLRQILHDHILISSIF
jgi:hypothetical protein